LAVSVDDSQRVYGEDFLKVYHPPSIGIGYSCMAESVVIVINRLGCNIAVAVGRGLGGILVESHIDTGG
jgi:hypothetical protein